MWLRHHGIAASVVGHHIHDIIPFPTVAPFATGLDLLLLIPEQRAEAERLLDDMQTNPPDPGWEPDATPDVSALDTERFPVTCTSCHQHLPVDDPALPSCPACRAPVDLVERIVELHGPEALVDCYPPVEGDEEASVSFDPAMLEIPCPGCGESLAGLPQVGRCRACGQLFDKADLFEKYFR